MVGEDEARIAFPIVTGAEDMEAPRVFTVVERSIADLMLQVAGEPDGIDDTDRLGAFLRRCGASSRSKDMDNESD